MDDQTLEDRLRTVERAIDDDTATPRPDHDARLDDIEARLRDLEAATQALRGYVGDVRDRDDETHRRADAALAEVKRLDTGSHPIDDTHPPTVPATEEDDDGLLDRIDEWL
ncbi:MAG: hypothetical protein ABEJ57_00165 [Halobacteriaceae archaeon]